jgi:glycosyltransferase involved in cell wall biosynthesis
MNPIAVSVIIPAYNASATIGQVLEALSKQNVSKPFEVIVVDDGSSDNTADIVRSFIGAGLEPARTKYIRQENAGPASARNHGAQLARGEFLAFTDSDCIPHEDWISQLMEGFSRGDPAGRPYAYQPSRPNIGAVAGSYGIANPQSALARCIYKEILWRHAHLMPDFPNSFGSYNFCVKKNVFDAVGGFNTAYRTASGEDNDLSYKITQSGWRICFQRKALVDHYHQTLVVKYLKEQFRHGFWRVKIYQDHPRMMKGDGYTYWKDIIEMPLGVCFLGGIALSIFHCVRLIDVLGFVLFPFLVFEILCALIMTGCFFDGIFFGFVLLCRAFLRMFGFSTGFLVLSFKKG